MTRRDRIAHSFSRASASYDRAAELQNRAAQSLAAKVLDSDWTQPRVLEVGCGTGGLTHLLLPRIRGPWLVTDIAPAMVETTKSHFAAPHAQFCLMDGEHPSLPHGSLDLIVSNLAVQWFEDLGQGLRRLSCCLAPQGRMLITTLGHGSLTEWRQAVAATGHLAGTPAYPTADEVAALLPRAKVRSEYLTLTYGSATEFLKSLKAIGATVPAPGYRPLPPPVLRHILTQMGTPCPITYEILTLDWTQT